MKINHTNFSAQLLRSRLDSQASKVFHVSFFGRIGYIIMAFFGALLSLFLFPAVHQYQNLSMPMWALIFIGIFFITGIVISLYSISQIFRFRPRFVITGEGFVYRGFISRFESRWSDVDSFRLRYAGSSPFIFLDVVFSNSPSLFRKRITLDASGLKPNYRDLEAVFKRYAFSSARRPSLF